MSQFLIPITDEQAKAVQAGFQFGGQSLEAARAFATYLAGILGSVPEDLVGLLGGDRLAAKRADNMTRIAQRASEMLGASGVEHPAPVSLSVALPLLRSASEEERPELVDLWAQLLAAAMDPSRSNRVRRSFVETVGKMEPLDAVVFQAVPNTTRALGIMRDALARRFGATSDQIAVLLPPPLRPGMRQLPRFSQRSAARGRGVHQPDFLRTRAIRCPWLEQGPLWRATFFAAEAAAGVERDAAGFCVRYPRRCDWLAAGEAVI